MNFVLETT